MYKYSFNPFYKSEPDWSDDFFSFLKSDDMIGFHRLLEGYSPTPLIAISGLASELNLKSILVKDESRRFGINSFKALGASYAIYRFLKKQWEIKFNEEFNPEKFKKQKYLKKLGSYTFCAATDGNHGRAVAWTSARLKQKAVIYMPDNTAVSRIKNIEAEGAEVRLINGTFDDCLKQCAEDAGKNGWQTIADTAYPGFMEIPKFIILGYTTIFRELEVSINHSDNADVDFIFVPAGVGGVAAAALSYYTLKYKTKRPKFICVEPVESDCFLESIVNGNGEPLFTKGNQNSIMAGLNCGMPSLAAWPIVRDACDFFIAVTDDYAKKAMKLYYKEGVISGESGASCLAGLLALFEDEMDKVRDELGLNKESRILLLNSEGDTDPVNYKKVIEQK